MEGKLSTDYANMENGVNSTTNSDSNNGTSSKKTLTTINDLNEQFMKSGIKWIMIAAILYIGIGVGIYHHVMNWDRLNALYFLTITLLTIGYGDYVPTSERERVFTAFYILLGIALCGTALGAVTTFLQKHQEKMAKKRNLRTLMMMQDEEGGVDFMLPRDTNSNKDSVPRQSDADEGSGSYSMSGDRPSVSANRRISLFQMAMSFSEPKRKVKSLQELRDASINAYEEDYISLQRSSILNLIAVFAVLIFGMLIMASIEDWNHGDAFYWAVVTIMTVGYGDLVPTSTSGKWFTIFYALIGCAIVAKSLTDFVKFPLLARLVKHDIEIINQFTSQQQGLSPELLQQIFDNELHQLIPDLKRNNNEMSKCEFVLMVLQLMSKVEEKDILLAAKVFDTLDTVGKGYFSKEDMTRRVEEARQRAGSIMQAIPDDFRSPSPSPLQRIKKIISSDGDPHRKRGSVGGFSSLRSSFSGSTKPFSSSPAAPSHKSGTQQGGYIPPSHDHVDNPIVKPIAINRAPAQQRRSLANIGFESISEEKTSGNGDNNSSIGDSML